MLAKRYLRHRHKCLRTDNHSQEEELAPETTATLTPSRHCLQVRQALPSPLLDKDSKQISRCLSINASEDNLGWLGSQHMPILAFFHLGFFIPEGNSWLTSEPGKEKARWSPDRKKPEPYSDMLEVTSSNFALFCILESH